MGSYSGKFTGSVKNTDSEIGTFSITVQADSVDDARRKVYDKFENIKSLTIVAQREGFVDID